MCHSAAFRVAVPAVTVGRDHQTVVMTDRTHLQDFDGSELLELWRHIECSRVELEACDTEYGRDTSVLSPRRFDETKVAGLRPYVHAVGLLAASWDHHWLLTQTLTTSGVTPHATWSLIRPAFEAAFHALWVLDPDGSFNRRRRGLQLELADAREQRLWAEAAVATGFSNADESRRALDVLNSTYQTLDREARLFNAAAKDMNRLANLVTDLPKLRSLAPMQAGIRAWLVAAWRQMSGMQHGHSYAMLAASQRSEVVEIPGGYQVLLSPNEEALQWHVKAAVTLHLRAVERYKELSLRPVST